MDDYINSMGLGSSQQETAAQKIELLFSPEFKGDVESSITEILKLIEDVKAIEQFSSLKLKPEHLPKLTAILSILIVHIHKYASKMNSLYTNLKDKAPPNNHEDIKSRILLLKKLLQLSIENSISLEDYFWNSNGKLRIE